MVRPDSSALMAVLCGHVFPETRKRSLDRRRKKGFLQNSVINSVAATTAAAWCNAGGAADDSLPPLFWRCHLKWHFVTQRRIPSLSPPLPVAGSTIRRRRRRHRSIWCESILAALSFFLRNTRSICCALARARSSLTRTFPPDNIQRGARAANVHFTFRCASLVLQPRPSCMHQLELGLNPKKRFKSIPSPFIRNLKPDLKPMRLPDFLIGCVHFLIGCVISCEVV